MHDIDPRQVITELLNTVPVDATKAQGGDRQKSGAVVEKSANSSAR
jgi:hypothetical protein